MEENKRKLKIYIIVIAVIIILAILLIPRTRYLNDGGTVEYKAFLYNVTKLHKLSDYSPTGYDEGTQEIDEGGIMPVEPRSYIFEENDILTKIRNYILCDIESVTYNGIECYRFTNHSHFSLGVDDEVYINKENGLLVRRTSERLEGEYRDIQDVLFKFDTITEEKINELIK